MDNLHPSPHHSRSRLARLAGYLLIPHELLHIAGYRLVGKRCHYRWGDPYVIPVGPMTRAEKLVGLLFPLLSCLFAWLLLFPAPFVALFLGGPTWAAILTALPALSFGYAFTAIGDLRQAYLLLYGASPRQKTPFDFFFWPLLTEARRVQILALMVLGMVVTGYVIYFFFF